MTTADQPHFLIWEPFKRPPNRRKGDPQSCMAALPLIGALVLKHGAKALLKKARGR